MSSLTSGAPFSLRGIQDTKIWRINEDETLGPMCDVKGIQNVGINPDISVRRFKNRCCTKRIRARMRGGKGTLQGACFSHKIMENLTGFEVVEGEGFLEFQARCGCLMPEIRIEAQICQLISSAGYTGGDYHMIIPRAVVTGWRPAHQTDTWWILDIQFDFLPTADQSLFTIRCNETLTDIA